MTSQQYFLASDENNSSQTEEESERSQSRISELLSNTPFATLFTVFLCTVVFVLQSVTILPTATLCAYNVVYLGEWYRLLSSGLSHADIVHLAMNMMSAAALGAKVERTVGSLALSAAVAWSLVLTSCVHVAFSALASVVLRSEAPMYACSLGFSAVLFHLATLEANVDVRPTRAVFGMSVPTRFYPHALLLVIQIFFPHVSFLGHLSGIVVGYMHFYGFLCPVLPSRNFLLRLEESRAILFCTRNPHCKYIPVPESSMLVERKCDCQISENCTCAFVYILRDICGGIFLYLRRRMGQEFEDANDLDGTVVV